MAILNSKTNFYISETWHSAVVSGSFFYYSGNEEGHKAGLYFGGTDAWEYLTNVDQDTAAEIHSASIVNDGSEAGVISFFNGEGVELFTLDIDDYVSGKIDGVIEALDADTVAPVIQSVDGNGDVTLTFKGVKEEDGVIAQGEGEDTLTLKKVATTGDAEDVTVAEYVSSEGGSFEGGSLQEVLVNIADQIAANKDAGEIVLEKKDGENWLKADRLTADGCEYQLKQGADVIFTANIEKDSFVKKGEVVYGSYEDGVFTQATEDEPGKAYIHLTIATTDSDAEDELYIAAASLVDQIFGTDGEIVVKDGVVGLAEKAKASLALADSAVQKVNGKEADKDGEVVIGADDIIYKSSDSEDITVKDALDAIDGSSVKHIYLSDGENKDDLVDNNEATITIGDGLVIDGTTIKHAPASELVVTDDNPADVKITLGDSESEDIAFTALTGVVTDKFGHLTELKTTRYTIELPTLSTSTDSLDVTNHSVDLVWVDFPKA